MKLIRKIQEDEMVAEFLKAEITSKRFVNEVRREIKKYHIPNRIIKNPNLKNADENQIRKRILGAYRGYGKKKQLFDNFPSKVVWKRIFLKPKELVLVRYINFDYWVKLSNQTRLPTDAARSIKAGIEVFGVSNQNFLDAAKALRHGKKFPPLILIAKNSRSRMVVLEGNLRLTAYLLEPKAIPDEIEAIIGYSPAFGRWTLY